MRLCHLHVHLLQWTYFTQKPQTYLHEILLFMPPARVEALRWDLDPTHSLCLHQQSRNSGGHRTGGLQGGCFPLNINTGRR